MSSAGLDFHPGRLWGLWDMLKVFGENYIQLGRQLQSLTVAFHVLETVELGTLSKHEREEHEAECRTCLKNMIKTCEELGFSTSQELVSHAYDDLPQTIREFDLLIRAVTAEVKKTFFLYVPVHLAKYYDVTFQSAITRAFPLASQELVSAGSCLAAGFFTASVFHAMRAAEIGVRVLGIELGVSFPDKPLELAEWQNILDQCDSKIVAMKSLPRGIAKDDALNFYSQAAVQFRYFKDAWRVRAAHARETFEEHKAIKIFDHTVDFFDVLSIRLREPKPAI